MFVYSSKKDPERKQNHQAKISTQTLDTTIIELEHKSGTAVTIVIMRNIKAAMMRILTE